MMNKNKFIKLGITFLAGLTALTLGKSNNVQSEQYTKVTADSNASVSIDYVNVAFANGPYLLYAVKAENTEELPSMYVWTTGDGIYDMEDAIELSIYQENLLIGGESYTTFIYDQISAKQMTDYIYARAYVEDTSSDLLRYSVLEYALATIKNHKENDSITVLLKDMLQYGTSSQKHFNYHTDRLANDEYHTLTLENCLLEDGFDEGMYTSKETIKVHSLDGSNMYWTKYENGEYSSSSYSDTFEIDGISHDAVVTACELPVRFNFINPYAELMLNEEPCFVNYVYAESSDYVLSGNELKIGDDVYSYTTITDLFEQKIIVTEVCSDPIIYNVNVQLDTNIQIGLSELSHKLEDVSTLMFYNDYFDLKGMILQALYNIDEVSEDDFTVLVINVETVMAIAQSIYSPYLAELEKLQDFLDDFLVVSSFYSVDLSALNNCRMNVYKAESTSKADEYIQDLWNLFNMDYKAYQIMEEQRQDYLKQGAEIRAELEALFSSNLESEKAMQAISELGALYANFRESIEEAKDEDEMKMRYDSFSNSAIALREKYEAFLLD